MPAPPTASHCAASNAHTPNTQNDTPVTKILQYALSIFVCTQRSKFVSRVYTSLDCTTLLDRTRDLRWVRIIMGDRDALASCLPQTAHESRVRIIEHPVRESESSDQSHHADCSDQCAEAPDENERTEVVGRAPSLFLIFPKNRQSIRL